MVKDVIIEKYIVFANNQQLATFVNERSAKRFCKLQRRLNPDSEYSYQKKVLFI